MTDALGLALRRLSENDAFSTFDSGDEDLNDFVQNDAPRLERCDVTRVYVALAGAELVGYIALLTDTIVVKGNERGRFDLTQQDSKSIPAVKVGRLAVDKRYQRRRIGEALMRAGYQIAVSTRRPLGCRLLTVDAYPASEAFYKKLGFTRNKMVATEDICSACKRPLSKCPHCSHEFVSAPSRTISMRFDLKVDPLPDWVGG